MRTTHFPFSAVCQGGPPSLRARRTISVGIKSEVVACRLQVFVFGLVQTRVTLGGVKRWATLAGRSCSAIIYGRNNAAVHRKKCYPGSERLEPGPFFSYFIVPVHESRATSVHNGVEPRACYEGASVDPTPKQLAAVTIHHVMVASIQSRVGLRGYFPDASSIRPTRARVGRTDPVTNRLRRFRGNNSSAEHPFPACLPA
jgi:hypothetical protein